MGKIKKNFIVVIGLLLLCLIVGIDLINQEKNNEGTLNSTVSWYQGVDSNHAVYSANSKNGYMDNRVIIYFQNDATKTAKAKAVESINGKIIGEDEDGNRYQVELPESHSLEELDNICNELEQLTGVFCSFPELITDISPNRINIPNDPWKDKIQGLTGQTWDEENPDGLNWWLETVKVPSAWKYNDRFSNIKIGVVDIGFDTEHEDLEIKVLNEDVNSKENHGTHVAGIIAATANNKKGITGIVWNKELYGVDVSATKKQKNNGTSILDVFGGIISALEAGCKVINVSMGAEEPLNDKDSIEHGKAYAENILYLEQTFKRKDFIIVQSAGNDNCNSVNSGWFCSITDETIQEMLNNKSEEVRNKYNKDDVYNHIIIVGALAKNTKRNELYNGFCYGEQVSLVAPGEDVFSTIVTGGIDGSYGDFGMTGTSMAAPIVSGVASLVWSVNPDFTANEVKEIVCNSTDKTAKGYAEDDNREYPIVNAKLAVEEAIRRIDGEINEVANDKIISEYASEFISESYENNQVATTNTNIYQTPQKTQINISNNPTAEELRNALIGQWDTAAYLNDSNHSYPDTYVFTADGKCQMLSTGTPWGTFEITDKLELKIKLPWNSENLKWDTNNLSNRNGWCISPEGYFIAKGVIHIKSSTVSSNIEETTVKVPDLPKLTLPNDTLQFTINNDINLLATNSDFKELGYLLENIGRLGYSFEYSSSNSNAYNIILSEILWSPIYNYIYGKEKEVFYSSGINFNNSPKSECDPLEKFGNYYSYGKVPADEIDWIIKNIFSVTPNRDNADVITDGLWEAYYYDGYYYFCLGDGGYVGVYPVIKNKKVNSENIYTVEYELISYDNDSTHEGTYKVICSLKNINSKRQWTLSSIKKVDNATNNNQTTVKVTDSQNQTNVTKISLEDLPLTDESHYEDNEGDSRVFNLNKNGLQGNDGRYYRNGNVSLDGKTLNNGFEVWVARWNYGDKISWASATFDLDGKYNTLTGKTDLIKSYNTSNFDTTVYFYDGEKLLASYRITPEYYQQEITVDVTGVKELRILVKDNIESAGGTSFALYDMFLT